MQQGGTPSLVYEDSLHAVQIEFPQTAYRFSNSYVEYSNEFETDAHAKGGTLLGRPTIAQDHIGSQDSKVDVR